MQVQLSTSHAFELELPPAITSSPAAPSANKILALIEAEEGKYQASLNDTYANMSEKTFKGLRRALPMTRSKLDWDRVRTKAVVTFLLRYVDFLCAGVGLQARCGAVVEQRQLRFLMTWPRRRSRIETYQCTLLT